MAKKNVTVLSFNYNTWACCAGKITKSAAKMKKIVVDDIKKALAWGIGSTANMNPNLNCLFCFPRC